MCRTILILLLGMISAAGSIAQLDHFTIESQGGGTISSQTAGITFFIEVLAQDTMNNTDTSFQGNVRITSEGILLNSKTTPSFVNGVLNSFSVTFSNTGTFTLTVTNTAGTQTGISNSFTVDPNTMTTISVETASDGTGTIVPAQNVVSGNSITMYLVARDSSANFIGVIAANSWSMQNKTGGVVSSNLVPSTDKRSATFTGSLIGSGNVFATISDLTAVSGMLTVISGTASKLTFIQQPSGTRAGSIITPAIKVGITDQAGNAIHTSGISVSLASANGTLNGTTAQLTDTNGVATFNDLSLNISGSNTLTATAVNLISALSNFFTITRGNPTHLVFIQQPTNAISGTTINPSVTVQVRDAFENNVDSSGLSVILALSSGTGTISGTTTRLTNTTGIATFDNLSVNLAGSKQFTTSSSGLTSATSSSFTISPGPLQNFLVESSAGGVIPSQTAGTAFTIKITARDTSNNTVTGFTETVNISSTGNVSSGGGITSPFVNGILSSLPVTIVNTGTFTITATHTSGTEIGISNSFVVTPGTPVSIRIETAANGTGSVVPPQSITAGNSITVYAIVRDSLGNFISNVAADSWTFQNILGGVVAGDLVPSGNSKSAVMTGHLAGSAQIHATSGTLLSINSNIVGYP